MNKDTIEGMIAEFDVWEYLNSRHLIQDEQARVTIRNFLLHALQKSFHAGLQRAGEIVKSVPRLDVYDGGETEREDGDYVNYATLLSALTKEGESK